MTISKDAFTPDGIHLEQVRNIKPCAYMGPGRFALDPFPIRYQIDSLTTIQFGTAPNGTELHGTYVNTA